MAIDIDIDSAGFVERETCYCDPQTDKPSKWRGREWWVNGALYLGIGLLATCPKCHAELFVSTDPDGTRHPMVRRAGFWRDVALDLADGKADAHPGTPAEWFVKCAVDRVLAADGLNATPAGETMQAEVDDGD